MMKQKIKTMLALQDALNSKVNPNWREENNAWYRAIWMESSEMLEHYGWKWWKKQNTDMMQVKLEVVDIMHFALSISLQSKKDLVQVIENIEKQFATPEQAPDLASTIERLALFSLSDKGAHYNFIAGIMAHIAMPFDELYRIYVGKNVLNKFRQNNGYKEGDYIKIWKGEEDNVHLARILESLNSDHISFQHDIYTALSQQYIMNLTT